MRGVAVNGKQVALDPGDSLVLPSQVDALEMVFGPDLLASNPPVRLRWQLDGFQQGWQDTKSVAMRMIVRFFDEDKELLNEKSFAVSGQTPGWTGRFRDSTFVDRKETVIVPDGATQFWIVLSSAGPPEAIGAFVVRDLVFSQPAVATNRTRVMPRVALGALDAASGHNPAPQGWIRDGLHLSDAHVVPYGDNGDIALALVDDGVDGHVDWATVRSEGWFGVAGEPLLIEWKEAYSISRGDFLVATYSDLPAGLYRFRIGGFTVMGNPTGVENSFSLTVPVALWTTPSFWGMVSLVLVGFALAGWRFVEWRRMTRQVKAVEKDRAVQQERVRIAQDIHDDLGARVTQISLLSSTAQQKHGLSAEARSDFEQVSELSRNMVTALYETVWAVDPENDHMDELGAYVCQMATQMCAQAKLKCRLMVPDLPQDVPLGSRIRHEIIMTIKEAIHNVIRHSDASELQIRILFQTRVLTVIVSDNGSGFDPGIQLRGNGLSNMKRRMESCQGTCTLQSRPGSGTQVRLELSLSVG